MKKFLYSCLIFIFLFCFCSLVAFGCEEKDYSINVMSFNIRCLALEPELKNMWENRKDEVLDVIKSYNPDIVGFQELKQTQYTFLQDNLEEYDYYGEQRSNGFFSSEASAIFWKKDRFEALEKQTFWLSETPEEMSIGWDASLPRVCTQITFKDKLSDEIFTHFNTHLDHQGDVARTESVNLLLDRIELNDKPTVLSGDFNFHEGSERYDLLLQDLTDTKYAAPEDNSDTGQTYNGFGKSTGDKPIDFIFTNQSFSTNSYKIIRDSDEEGNYPSDHFPVLVNIELK